MPRSSTTKQIATVEKAELKAKRSWSASQLHRKRQLDRESQRLARAKTRGRIEHLEALVRTLQENDDDRIKKLLSKIDEQQSEIQRLRDVVRGIDRLIDTSKVLATTSADVGTNDGIYIKDQYQLSPSSMSDDSTKDIAPDATSQVLDIVTSTHPLSAKASLDLHRPLSPACSTPLDNVSDSVPTVSQLAASIADDYQLDGRLWYLAGGVLSHILKFRLQNRSVATTNDEDIAIRAVTEGWPAVLTRHSLDYGWQWLKELDERIYSHLPAHVRLMHMRNTRLVFVHQMDPSSGAKQCLPSFFHPRPSQAFINHDPLVEHFPWPAFRERLLFSPLRFATNKFMDTLRMNVEFTWNLDESELYVRDCATGLYSYSAEVTNRMMDIRCYAAKRDFFEIFPELRADIPCCAATLNDLFPKVVSQRLKEEDQMLNEDVFDRDSPARMALALEEVFVF